MVNTYISNRTNTLAKNQLKRFSRFDTVPAFFAVETTQILKKY